MRMAVSGAGGAADIRDGRCGVKNCNIWKCGGSANDTRDLRGRVSPGHPHQQCSLPAASRRSVARAVEGRCERQQRRLRPAAARVTSMHVTERREHTCIGMSSRVANAAPPCPAGSHTLHSATARNTRAEEGVGRHLLASWPPPPTAGCVPVWSHEGRQRCASAPA